MKTLIAVLFALGTYAESASAESFDSGVDVSAALSSAKAAAAAAPDYKRPAGDRRPDRFAHDVECKVLSVPITAHSERSISLESHDLDCDDAYNTCSSGSRNGSSHSGSALVILGGSSDAKPWETADFRFCMEGTMIDFSVEKDNPFGIGVVQQGSAENDWTWIVETLDRRAAKSDPAGVRPIFATAAGGSGNLLFVDKWAEHYQDGAVEIRLEIKRDRNNLQDETLYANTLSFATASSYSASLAGLFFKADGKYYVTYSIRRSGEKEFGKRQRAAAEVSRPRIRG